MVRATPGILAGAALVRPMHLLLERVVIMAKFIRERATGNVGRAQAAAAGLAFVVAACGSSGSSESGGDAGADGATPIVPDYIWYVLDETTAVVAHDSSQHHYDISNLTGVTWNSGANFDGKGGGGSVNVDSSYRSPPITISPSSW